MGMEDADADTRDVAAEYVLEYGSDAPAFLHAEATRARIKGDKLSAEAWDDIAILAQMLVNGVRH
jgi:hypothetical protein